MVTVSTPPKNELSRKTSARRATTEERDCFKVWLQSEFANRCKKNNRYSLRAFAKYLGLDASSLSQILAGTRGVSLNAIERISASLAATPRDRVNFGLDRSLKNAPGATEFYQVNIDTFTAISDWYHYAILELTFVDGFKSEPRWIARKLSITVEEARGALERLVRLGLLLREGTSLVKASRFHTNQSAQDTSAAHRQLQRQLVDKALLAIDHCQPTEKDITSMTMAIDVSNLDRARKLIQKFRRDLCSLLENGDQTRIYNLGIQLYPLSEDSKKESKP